MCIGVGDDAVTVVSSSFDAVIEERLSRFAQPVLVQEFVTGEEVGVPLLRIGEVHAFPPVTFRRKDGSSFLDRPRTFREEVIEGSVAIRAFDGDPESVGVLQSSARLAFDALGMKGAARVDFRLDADGRAWAFDTNESPPPLPATSWAVSIAELGFDIDDMLATWLGVCLIEAGLLSGV